MTVISLGTPEDEVLTLVIQLVVENVAWCSVDPAALSSIACWKAAAACSLHGVPFLPDAKGVLEFTFDRDLSEIEAENTDFVETEKEKPRGSRMGLRIEPSSVELIAVWDAETGEVVQARQCDLVRARSGK